MMLEQYVMATALTNDRSMFKSKSKGMNLHSDLEEAEL